MIEIASTVIVATVSENSYKKGPMPSRESAPGLDILNEFIPRQHHRVTYSGESS
jgi:hypothetical protein